MRQVSAHLLSASAVMGDKVTNTEGEDLGELKELVIDSNSGRVAYAVLRFGGFLGLGEKLFAVPWEAFRMAPDENRLYLEITRDRLKDAPGFDRNHWPADADREFYRRVYSYYGYQPYWETSPQNIEPDDRAPDAYGSTPDTQARIAEVFGATDLSGGAGQPAAVIGGQDDSMTHPTSDQPEDSYSGRNLTGEAMGMSAADIGPSPGQAHAPEYGSEHENAGLDDRLSDEGGSPARGYGRGGINAQGNVKDSMNPGNTIGDDWQTRMTDRSEYLSPSPDYGTTTESLKESEEQRISGGGDEDSYDRSRANLAPGSGTAFTGGVGTGPGGSDLNARDVGHRGSAGSRQGLEYTRRSRDRRAQDLTEDEQRALGEQAADEFNPGLTGGISDIDSSRSSAADADSGFRGTPVPGDNLGFERGQELPSGGEPANIGGMRDMSGASGLSSASSTGGSEGMSAAEDLEVGSVDDLNVVGTNLGEEYPPDMTVTEDEDMQQPSSIRPGTRRGSSEAGDIPAGDADSNTDEDRDVGSTGSGRGHSSGSSTGNRHRGSEGDQGPSR